MTDKKKQIIHAAIPIIIALLSIFVVARFATSTDFHANTIASLNESKKTVSELIAASTAASAAITVIPGDVATPIAEKLADVSGYFIIVICAIYLELYLLTITGYVAFYFLIPIACILALVYQFYKKDILKQLAGKLIVFAVIIVSVIPVSVKISDIITASYGSSIEQTLENAKKTTDEIQQNAPDETTSENESWLGSIISSAKDTFKTATAEVETVLNNMIDALAVMLVTACVIPVLVILFFLWLAKLLMNGNSLFT